MQPQQAEVTSVRKPKPTPTRSLIAAAARVYRTTSDLGSLVLGARSVDAYLFQTLIERLNGHAEQLDAVIHGLEAREGRAPRRVPIRALIVRSARIRHMVAALNDLAFAGGFDEYRVGTRVEQLEQQIAQLEQTVHGIERSAGK